MDNLTVKLTYPGADAPAMTVTDPLTNSTIDLNFTGGTVLRTSLITYLMVFMRVMGVLRVLLFHYTSN